MKTMWYGPQTRSTDLLHVLIVAIESQESCPNLALRLKVFFILIKEKNGSPQFTNVGKEF